MKITKYSLLLFLICNFGCIDFAKPGAREYYEINKTMRMSVGNTAAVKKLSSFPIDKQIDVYLFANANIEGGSWINPIFTKDGEQKIPFIIKRMEVFPNDIRTEGRLMEALYHINKDCNCLKKHPSDIETLESIGERIKTEESSLEDEVKNSYIDQYNNSLKHIKGDNIDK